jgi:hypothetical protein
MVTAFSNRNRQSAQKRQELSSFSTSIEQERKGIDRWLEGSYSGMSRLNSGRKVLGCYIDCYIEMSHESV